VEEEGQQSVDIDTSKEPVPNQPYSENMVSPLPKHTTWPQPPDVHTYINPAANAPEVYIAPPPLSPLPQTMAGIDQELQIIEEGESQVRIRREMHQEVLRLHLEEERLRTRKAELLMAKGGG
jgi:hypothetical protein